MDSTRPLVAAALVACLALLGACGDSTSDGDGDGYRAGQTHDPYEGEVRVWSR